MKQLQNLKKSRQSTPNSIKPPSENKEKKSSKKPTEQQEEEQENPVGSEENRQSEMEVQPSEMNIQPSEMEAQQSENAGQPSEKEIPFNDQQNQPNEQENQPIEPPVNQFESFAPSSKPVEPPKEETNPQSQVPNKNLLMTEVPLPFDSHDLYTFHDLIVPGGKNARLCLINEPFNKNLRITEIADHFQFYEPTPVIVLIGANTKRKVKLFAGLSRAALNCRAVIIDSGLQTGVERFCLRKNIELIGIAPESQIEYPKINPEPFSSTLLTNGHTHFILIGKDDKKITWGQEAKIKVGFAERLANGRKGAYSYKTKVVGVILGNITECVEEILMFIERQWPLILIEDSELAQNIKEVRNGSDEDSNKFGEQISTIGKYAKLIEIDDDSENLAASIHICLTLSF